MMRIKYFAKSDNVSISSFVVAKDAKKPIESVVLIEIKVLDAIARKLNCNDYRIRDDLVSFGNSIKGSCPTESITVCYPDVEVDIDTDEFEERFSEELAELEANTQAWRNEREKDKKESIL